MSCFFYYLINSVVSTSKSPLEYFPFAISATRSPPTKASIRSSDFPCKNPTEDYLMFILSEYSRLYMRHKQAQFSKFSEGFEYEELSEEIYKTYLSEHHFLQNSQCSKSERNRTSISQQSLCPWKHVIKYRPNKYPHYVTNVICTCDKCSDPELHKCSPVMRINLILEKTEDCDKDGISIWKPSSEFVNVACVCAESNKIIPRF